MPRKSVSGRQNQVIITLRCTRFITGFLSTAPIHLTLHAQVTVEVQAPGI